MVLEVPPRGGGAQRCRKVAWMLSDPRAGPEERWGVRGGVGRKMKVKTDSTVTQLY
jgi:hypothetical protein